MSKVKRRLTADYASLLREVKERVRAAQYAALKAVNKELVALYWDIGRLIVSLQVDAEHGTAIAEQLASDLRREFPSVAGYSRRNIFYMREFYLAYRDLPKGVGAPIGVATYRTVQNLPKELKGQLPAPEQIASLFEEAF